MENDSTLLESAKRMDREALVRVFDLYASALFYYALRLCGDPVTADHIVGDVFAKLLEQLAAGAGPRSNLRSYLYEMTYHLIVDEARASQRKAPLEAAAWLGQNPFSEFSGFEDKLLFQRILHTMRNELSADQRHVVMLRFLEEFSLRETASIMGKNVGHVKVLQGRALAKLRKLLEL